MIVPKNFEKNYVPVRPMDVTKIVGFSIIYLEAPATNQISEIKLLLLRNCEKINT